jgi:hypothetical protein
MQVAAPTLAQTSRPSGRGCCLARVVCLWLAMTCCCWHTTAWAEETGPDHHVGVASGAVSDNTAHRDTEVGLGQAAVLSVHATQTEAEPVPAKDQPSGPAKDTLPAGRVVAVPARTAWIKFLGWSADGSRLAFRPGAAATANRPGDPCTIVRLGPTGHIAATLVVQRDVMQALIDRRIHSVRSAPSEAVSDTDVLLAPLDERLAAVVRDAPTELAVLRRDRSGRYQPVLRQPLAAGDSLQAWAYGNPTGTLVAVVAEVASGQDKFAYLFVIPTTAPTPPSSGAGQP